MVLKMIRMFKDWRDEANWPGYIVIGIIVGFTLGNILCWLKVF